MAQLHHPTSERFPAIAYPKSLGAHNLPVQLTSLVGRALELTQVGELGRKLAGDPDRRGWGGKTRLALFQHVYSRRRSRWRFRQRFGPTPPDHPFQQPPGCLDSIASSYRQIRGGHGGNTADATVCRPLRNGLATTICRWGLKALLRSSTVIAGSAYRANARSADGL
jgi:hypothetical protein